MDKIKDKNAISLDSKKRVIEYKLLNDGCCYDNMVFHLIGTKYFDKIISKIDDDEMIYGVKVTKNDNITSENFLFLLDRLVDLFKTKFPTIKSHYYIMEKIDGVSIDI